MSNPRKQRNESLSRRCSPCSSRNFVERLVEDLIQESMSRGDFNNIRSSGKPIHERNPHYMDFTTYKINEILIDNGKATGYSYR